MYVLELSISEFKSLRIFLFLVLALCPLPPPETPTFQNPTVKNRWAHICYTRHRYCCTPAVVLIQVVWGYGSNACAHSRFLSLPTSPADCRLRALLSRSLSLLTPPAVCRLVALLRRSHTLSWSSWLWASIRVLYLARSAASLLARSAATSLARSAASNCMDVIGQ